jgi:hypothetical protein
MQQGKVLNEARLLTDGISDAYAEVGLKQIPTDGVDFVFVLMSRDVDQFHYVMVGVANPLDVINDVFHALVDAGIMSRSPAHETVLKWVLEQLEKEDSNESPQTH